MEAGKARKMAGKWSFMNSPSPRDIRGPRRTRKALDTPEEPYDYLVVLDFEWVCDKWRQVLPLEIIEFPSVLVRCSFPPAVVDEFQVYCRPQVNPVLSKFCTELTGITQAQVDGGVLVEEALSLHTHWLRKHNLLPPCAQPTHTNIPTQEEHPANSSSAARNGGKDCPQKKEKKMKFAIVTWSDADVAGALNKELSRLGLPRPAHFDAWINLKLLYKRHFKREPRGGLQACVESCGLAFEGRAHSGLVDSRNTAAICLEMLRQGFVFTRSTRGFAPDGRVWGQKKRGGGEK